MSVTRLHRLKNEVGHHSLFFVLTNRCDTICRYCSCMPVLRSGWTELPTAIVIDLLQWFAERREGLQTVQFSGGEPLLHPGIFQFLRSAQQLGYITRLQSNGIAAGSLSDSDALYLKDVRTKISIDGPTPEVHEQYRRKGSFDYVVKGIQRLVACGITVGAKAVFSNSNVRYGGDLIRFVGELGVHGFTYNTMEYVGYARSLTGRSTTEYEVTRAIIDTLCSREYRHLLNGTNILRWYLADRPILKDRLPWFINERGDVFRGQVFRNMQHVGNVYRNKWDEIFDSRNPGYETMRCEGRTYSLIKRKLGAQNLLTNVR
ncbi:radical SAM protein [Burkholderia diffusa]|uniref:radical SAM protein n=1 Tax=Burkholderia diffusa TaxID=488732 RepID=UPI002651B47B|nr:radical SAM protein [Burkholderia diffusa]MDN7905550.1 radical SAM protein [Burkholderia diffusa]